MARKLIRNLLLTLRVKKAASFQRQLRLQADEFVRQYGSVDLKQLREQANELPADERDRVLAILDYEPKWGVKRSPQ